MCVENIVERILEAAVREGKFDNLAGQGCPVDLEGYFQTPAHLRAGFAILKNAFCVPQEVTLLKEIEDLESYAALSESSESQRVLSRQIGEKRLNLALLLERQQRQR